MILVSRNDDAGFAYQEAKWSKPPEKKCWETDMLPAPPHHGSHTFIAHEFIDGLVKQRCPLVDIYIAMDFTIPGISAQHSAVNGGKQLKIPQFSFGK